MTVNESLNNPITSKSFNKQISNCTKKKYISASCDVCYLKRLQIFSIYALNSIHIDGIFLMIYLEF